MGQTPGLKDSPFGRVKLPSSGGSGTSDSLLNLGRKTRNQGCSGCATVNPHGDLCGIPPPCFPQPVIDASVVTMWRWWITPILTPLWRKVGSCHSKSVWKQLRDTLSRRVAGPVKWILYSLMHQRNGLMWSNPRGSTRGGCGHKA